MTYGNYDDMLADPNVDAVIIGIADQFHVEAALALEPASRSGGETDGGIGRRMRGPGTSVQPPTACFRSVP